MTPFDFPLPDQLRAALRTSFAALPTPAAEMADELADLTYHAVNEAIGAIDRTAARAPSLAVQIAVMSAAVSTTRGMLEMIQNSLVSTATEMGATVTIDRMRLERVQS